MTMHSDKAIGMWCFKENSFWMQDHENKLGIGCTENWWDSSYRK